MWQHIIIAQQQQPPGGEWSFFIMMAIIFGIFWVLVIRPQQKRHKEHQEYLGALKKDDKVVTAGGIFGTIEKVDGNVVTLRITRDTKIKVLRQQIEGSQASYLGDEDAEDDKKEEKAS